MNQMDIPSILAHVQGQWRSLRYGQGAHDKIARVSIFGAGEHSQWLESVVRGMEGPTVVAVLDDHPLGKQPLWGIAPVMPTTWKPSDDEIIILSSDTVAEQMSVRCRELYGNRVWLVNLYDGLPPGPYPKASPRSRMPNKCVVAAGKDVVADSTWRSRLTGVVEQWMSGYLPDPALVKKERDFRWKLFFALYAYRLKWRFKDKHCGEEAILLGSGPSVRIEDLEKMKGFVTFACNRFYRCYDRTSFRPTYLASADRTMISDFGEEMSREAKCPLFLNTMEDPGIHHANVFWVPSIIPHCAPLVFQETMFKGLFCGGGTLIGALQIGYYMGIRKFYLYGVDHDFNYQKVETKDRARSAVGDANHFIANYRDGKAWFPPATNLIEKSFCICDQFLRSRNGFLKNATCGGKLEALERVSIEKVLNEKGSVCRDEGQRKGKE